MRQNISRREFFKVLGLASLGIIGRSCNLTTPEPEATQSPVGLSPELKAKADLLLGERQWQVAKNFSAYTVLVGNHNIDYVDLSSPGQIFTRDSLGQKETSPESADNASNRVQLLFIPNYLQMTAEMFRNTEQEPAHDSQAIWALGSGDLQMTYYWNGGGGSTVLTGYVKDNQFRGNRDGLQDISIPACFQTAHFDMDGNLDQVPAAILVSMRADQSTFLNLTTGPTSFDDTDGNGNQDWQDAGWKFSR